MRTLRLVRRWARTRTETLCRDHESAGSAPIPRDRRLLVLMISASCTRADPFAADL
jgi:hypothetical protein